MGASGLGPVVPCQYISGHLLLYGIPPLRNLIFLPTRHALTQRANTSHCLQHIRHAVSGLSCDSFHLRKSASARAAIIYLLARPDQASCRLCTLHRHSVVHVLDLGFPAPDKHANSPITTRVRIATACNSTNSVVFFFHFRLVPHEEESNAPLCLDVPTAMFGMCRQRGIKTASPLARCCGCFKFSTGICRLQLLAGSRSGLTHSSACTRSIYIVYKPPARAAHQYLVNEWVTPPLTLILSIELYIYTSPIILLTLTVTQYVLDPKKSELVIQVAGTYAC